MDWLDNIAGAGYTSALLWTFAALILLVIVLVIIKLVRSLTSGTFVAGGRNRKTRLAVMDATAVDSNRRLVLVRRDDVEHLLLIGGPTDLLVERDIRLNQQRRPSLAGENNLDQPARPRPLEQQPAPRPAPAPRAAEPVARPMPQPGMAPGQPATAPSAPYAAPQPMAATPQPMAAAPQPVSPFSPQPVPPAAPQPMARPAPAPMPRPEPRIPLSTPPVPPVARQEPAPSAPAPQVPSPAPEPQLPSPEHDGIDESLLKELEVSFQEEEKRGHAAPEVSLDDEMARLLGELSNQNQKR